MSGREDGGLAFGPDEFDDDHLDFDEEDGDDFDCGLGPDGQCALAGTEDCDWECPNSRGPFYAGSAAWDARHDAGVPIDGCFCPECRAARSAP